MAKDAVTKSYTSGNETIFGAEGTRAIDANSRDRSVLPTSLGPYEVVEAIGQGGMGMVLKCRDNTLKRDVAIKVMHPDVRNNPDSRMRFIKEAQITGQLEHPGIVSVHYLGWDEGEHEFFSMKLATGRPLHELLERWHKGDREIRAELPLPRLISIFERICETISFAHSRGVIHRDLKPSNVMIGKHGEVWVLDWGLAKLLNENDETAVRRKDRGALNTIAINDVTLDGTVVGTPEYMAPEQACGQALDEGVDIFGLGALLFEILTGQPPHSGKTVQEVVNRAAKARIPVIKRAGGRPVSKALVAMTRKCLAAHRKDRYASVEDLLRDVRAYAAGETVSVLPDTAMDRILRFVRRHKRSVASAATAAIVLLITICVSAALLISKDREARDAETAQQHERAARLEAELEKQKALAATAETARKRFAAFEPYARAMDLLSRGQLPEQSAQLLRDALAIDSDFPEAQFALGEALRSGGHPLEAAAAYLKADKLSRKIAGRPNLHAIVNAGFALDGAGSYREAEDAFALAENEGANDPLAQVGKVFRLTHNENLVEARRVAEEARKAAPHLWETHFAVGYTLHENINGGLLSPSEWLKPAIAALRKAIELSPRQAEAWTWLAIVLSRSNKHEDRAEALACGERAVMLEPGNGNRYITRAGYRLSGGDLKGAAEDRAEACRLNVSPALLDQFDARMAGAKGDFAEAYRKMSQVVEESREWPANVANCLILGYKLNKFDEISAMNSRLSVKHPDYPFVFVIRGALKVKDGDLPGAISQAREGLKLAPYHLYLHTMLSTWLYADRQYADALAAIDKTIELGKNDATLKVSRLDCLLKLGRAPEAQKAYDALQKEYPDKLEDLARYYEQFQGSPKK